MKKGDIVLVSFPFTNLSGSKYRPAVVLCNTSLDFTACFITSQTDKKEPSDILIVASQTNGLKMDSVIRTNKIATLDKQLAKGLLGTLSQSEIDELNMQLKILLAL
ncbi:MAG: type II toxin-antitoxin system PemK/MazF family toxin [Saprospiraceae bacterium]|nr:type II toxin-antitoxin system PemK/MazF family toxin [Candidatus Vicinibacter affinis]